MSNRIINIAMVALTMIAILPTAADAQRSARIRVSARVVGSVVPETLMAAEAQLDHLAKAGIDEETTTIRAARTENGFAHVYTERLAPEVTGDSNQATPAQQVVEQAGQDRVRLTVAYTAN